jgi:hypothetical protein
VCAAGLAALSLERASDEALVEVGWRVAALALLALVAGIVIGWPPLVPTSLILLGGLYGAELAVDEAALDAATPLVAAGLVVAAELGYWSLEEREPVLAEPGEALRRLAFVTILALGVLLVTAVLLALVDAVRARGLALDLLGAAAAASAVLAVVVLARRQAQT